MDTQSVSLSIHLCRSVCDLMDSIYRSVLPTALPLSGGSMGGSIPRPHVPQAVGTHRHTHTFCQSQFVVCVCLSVCLCLCVLTRHSHTVSVSGSLLLCVCSFVRESIPPPDSTLCLSPRFILIRSHIHSLSIVCVSMRGRERSILVSSILSQPALPVWRHWADRSDPHSTILKRLALSLTPSSSRTHTLCFMCACSDLSLNVSGQVHQSCVYVFVYTLNR
jgi:hypothetical protein